MATGLRLAGILATGALFLLPTGFWMSRMLVEAGMVAGYFAVLLGAMLLWRGRLSGLPVVLVAVVWLFAVRSASGMAVALTLLAASAIALLIRIPDRRGPFITGGVAVGAIAVWGVISTMLGLPGLNETIQDFATVHFTRPDTPDPIGWLVDRNLKYWPKQIAEVVASPGSIIAMVFAAVVLIRRMRPVAWLWIIIGTTGVMMMVAHPTGSQYDRLMLTLWIPVSCVLGYAAALAVRRPASAVP
jgi:hypothetical protein